MLHCRRAARYAARLPACITGFPWPFFPQAWPPWIVCLACHPLGLAHGGSQPGMRWAPGVAACRHGTWLAALLLALWARAMGGSTNQPSIAEAGSRGRPAQLQRRRHRLHKLLPAGVQAVPHFPG